MPVRTAVTLDEYLRTSYEYEPEFVDGELVERTMPSLPHGVTAAKITIAFGAARSNRLYPVIDVRLRVTPTRYRIPDVSIFADAVPHERYPSKPPFGVIEILSPDDSLSDLYEKLDEYERWGIQRIWLVDPEHNGISRYEQGSLLRVDAIEIPDRGFKLAAADLFAPEVTTPRSE